MKELKDMTVAELEQYKKQLYKDNTDNGNITKLLTIGRKLGTPLNNSYGPKYRFTQGDVEIYVDDYGHYMTVTVAGKLRVSTHNGKLYSPGEWEKIIPTLWPKADEIGHQLETALMEKRKQELLEQLT